MIIGKADKTLMAAFTKALSLFLKEKEGIIVNVGKKLYMVYKARSEDDQMLLYVSDDLSSVKEGFRHEGQMLWIHDESENIDLELENKKEENKK